MSDQPHENHIFQWWMHQHWSAPASEVRKATDDPLVHAVLDWLTLPTEEPMFDQLQNYLDLIEDLWSYIERHHMVTQLPGSDITDNEFIDLRNRVNAVNRKEV